MVPSVPLLPLCSSHLCCNNKSTTGQFRTQIHTLATSLTMESFAIPCCKQPCLSPRETAPKTPSIHPSGHRLVFLFEKRKLFISMSCLENSQDFRIPIRQSGNPSSYAPTLQHPHWSKIPTRRRWPIWSDLNHLPVPARRKKNAPNFHSSNRWRIDPTMAFSSLKISGSAMTP